MEFQEILHQIREVRIQGARNIAEAGIFAFLKNPSKASAKQIIATRPTEPLLQNSLSLILKSKDQNKTAKRILSYLRESEKEIAQEGQELIKNGMNIFTHCHSSTVIDILKKAKKHGKEFVVYNTETGPLLQGRKTAEELADAGIKVIHLPDTAMEQGLKQCDIFLFGADAYLPKGVVNKTGTSTLCRLAKIFNIPTYSCGISMKYAKKIEIEYRSGKEVWNERNKLIQVVNPAFDLTEKDLVTGVVSELGIHSYPFFIKKAKTHFKHFLK